MPTLKNKHHEDCVQAFLSNGGNQSAAYRIGYKSSLKWKDKTVWESASKLFALPKVQTRIKELQAKLEKKEILSKEAILDDLREIATGTIEDYIESIDSLTGMVKYVDPRNETCLYWY